jgi:hypothetical protein
MILSFSNELFGDSRRRYVRARVTNVHPASSYGQQVIVLEDGHALDPASWTLLDYQVEAATRWERQSLKTILHGIKQND